MVSARPSRCTTSPYNWYWPAGIGGTEGGMIGAFAAFGIPGDRAIVGVLAYRAISFWLPTIPGLIGYLRLRTTVRSWRTDGEGANA